MDTNHPLSVLPKSSTEIPVDEIVEDIHAHRAELAARFGYDIEQLFSYYQQQEDKNPAPRATETVGPA
jgi:hypothetical protein